MVKSSQFTGQYKNIGKQHPHERRREYYRPSVFAALQPFDIEDSRQVIRRKVIVQRQNSPTVRFWKKTGPAERLGGPTPARRPRPKAHRWLLS